ncbi:MAG: segregation/condensation protein A [Holophagales bacterium]|nr:segregation/condensation protein A [Holophagales bacterium]
MASPLPTLGVLPESWHVRLPDFEGPLDLLLHLIKEHELEITDIPVALVCEQFHRYLELMETLELDIAAEYIYMAAYLIHLKSRMLLPRPRDLEGQEIDEDPRRDLVARLLEYRRIKEAAQGFAEVESLRRGMWPRHTDEMKRITQQESREIDISDLSLFDLLRTFRLVLDRYEREHPEPLVLPGESFSVRDQIERLIAAMGGGRPIDLFDDLRTLSGRREAIAAFLAILEMARMQLVRMHQSRRGLLLYRTERELSTVDLEAVRI